MKGDPGQPCNQVCAGSGGVCNSDKQSAITTYELIAQIFLEAGFTCKGNGGSRSYAGAPFTVNTKCYYIAPGATSSCTEIKHEEHSPLCYCDLGN